MRLKGFFLSWAPALLVMGLVFFLSSLPGDEVPLPSFPFSDKAAHFGAYTLLGICLFSRRFLRRSLMAVPSPASPTLGEEAPSFFSFRRPSATVTGFTAGLLFALSDELHQLLVPLREPSLADLAADAAGLLAGFWVVRMGAARLRRG